MKSKINLIELEHVTQRSSTHHFAQSFYHIGLPDTSQHMPMIPNNNTKSLCYGQWLCQITWMAGIFPSWTRFFLRKNSGKFEGNSDSLKRYQGGPSHIATLTNTIQYNYDHDTHQKDEYRSLYSPIKWVSNLLLFSTQENCIFNFPNPKAETRLTSGHFRFPVYLAEKSTEELQCRTFWSSILAVFSTTFLYTRVKSPPRFVHTSSTFV